MFGRKGDQRLVALDAELLSAMSQVGVDRRHADPELLGDRLGRVPRAEPLEALLLPFGQLIEVSGNSYSKHAHGDVGAR